MADIPENNWTWRRPLIWLLSIGGFLLAAFIVVKLAGMGEASVPALRDIALAGIAESTVLVTLYILGAGQEYAKLVEAAIKAFDEVKG